MLFDFIDKMIDRAFDWTGGSLSRQILITLMIAGCVTFLVVLMATGMACVVCLLTGWGS